MKCFRQLQEFVRQCNVSLNLSLNPTTILVLSLPLTSQNSNHCLIVIMLERMARQPADNCSEMLLLMYLGELNRVYMNLEIPETYEHIIR